MKDAIISFLKGLWIGGTMTVPGVSGGAMAMIMGVYDRLIYSVSHLFKDFKKSILFLIEFAIGGVIGFVLFSKLITFLLTSETFSLPFRFFFVGAVAGGIPIIFKSAKVKKFSAGCVIFPLLGAAIAIGIWIATKKLHFGGVSSQIDFKFVVFQIVSGVLAAIALVIPGISLTQIFVMLGIYGGIMEVVGNLDIKGMLIYVPMGLIAVVGTYVIAKLLEPAMKNYPLPTYLLIFGFLLGSIPQLLLEDPSGVDAAEHASFYATATPLTWVFCAVAAVAGFCALYFLSRLEIKRIQQTEDVKVQ